MKTIAKIILSLLMMVQMSSLSFADADPANPAKTQKPCGFPDNMNCFENKKVADAEEVNANFKALLDRVDNINSVNGKIGIGTTAKNNILHIKGSVSINSSEEEEHHPIGGMSIIHGGPSFPERAMQIRPGVTGQDSYIFHSSKDVSGNFYWWTYSVHQDKTFRINPAFRTDAIIINSNGNVGIGAIANNNGLYIKGSVSINNGTDGEHHAIGGMSIIHGGHIFPERALQIVPGNLSQDSYILHSSKDSSGNHFWWTYSVHQDKTLRINPPFKTDAFVIDSGGNIGIGTLTPNFRLHVNGIARADSCTWSTSSDRRVKKNITPLTGSLQKIQKLQPVTFEYIDEYKEDKESLDGKQMGFIAQDVKQICPEMVTTEKETFGDQTIEDFHLLNTSNLTPMLIDAIKELKAEVDTLKARIEALESKNSGLFSEN